MFFTWFANILYQLKAIWRICDLYSQLPKYVSVKYRIEKAWLLSFYVYNSIVFYTKEMFVSKTKSIWKPFLCKCMPKNISEPSFKSWKIRSIVLDSINKAY